MIEISKCRSCGASVYWLRTAATDALIPLDAVPAADGNIAIVDEKAVVLSGSMFDAVTPNERYKSHFATCVDAAKWRKKARKP